MSLVRRLHGALVVERRTRVLAEHLAELLPADASVLDVGCGDGRVARRVAALRSDLRLEGVDVYVRPRTFFPVIAFDGRHIPHPDGAFDAAVLVDVLHHTDDPAQLLAEAARVARRAVVLKDHLLAGPLAHATLRFMDRTGNPEQGVSLPYNYWPEDRWREAFAALGLRVEAWRPKLGLFAPPADWIFGRGLHFVARLAPASSGG